MVDGAPLVVKMGHVTSRGIEFINMGKFYLEDYIAENRTMKFIATGLIKRLDRVKFYGFGKSQVTGYETPIPTTIKEVITAIMNKIGLASDQYEVPDYLDIISLPDNDLGPMGWTGRKKLQTGREILKKIGIYYGLVPREDREGKIIFDYIDTKLGVYNEGVTEFYGNLVLQKTATGNIVDLDNCLSNPKTEQTDQLYKINYDAEGFYTEDFVSKQILAEAADYNVVDGSDIVIYLSSPATEHAYFQDTPITTGTAAIVDMFVYEYMILVKTSGTGTISFAIDDFIFQDSSQSNRILYSSIITKGYELDLFFARLWNWEWNWFYDEATTRLFNASKKYRHTAEWRQDLTNHLCDIVQIENEFDVEKYMIITQQIYEYNGALKGQTIGVGD